MIICVFSQKGGCGKSTTAALIARHLAGSGGKVLAIDTDPQGGLTSLLKARGKPGIADALMGEAVEPMTVDGLWVLGADHRLDKIAYTLPPYEIVNLLVNYQSEHIVVDCPPSCVGISLASAIAADIIIVPADLAQTTIGPTVYSLDALKQIKKRGKVLFIGREPKPEQHGYAAEIFEDFKKAVGSRYAGIVPRTANAQKAAAGRVKVPAAVAEILAGVLHG